MEKLYMLSIDDRDNLNNRIKRIKESLKDSNYRLMVTGKSIAVYIEEEKQNKESEEINIVESKHCKEHEDNIVDREDSAIEYRDFIYNMKSIARNISVRKN